ncbi:MAG: hypothetical protein L3I99_07770 [Sulfurimonas sp.]|nr:hypothetical protein [Sulfurimonas sp.]
MSKKIGLNVGGRRFDVDIDENFAPYLSSQIAKDFNIDGNNEIKVLLQAYIRKNYDLYSQEIKMQKLLDECNNLG